jgi:hypothetical protein
MMADNLLKAWDQISPQVIDEAWAVYQGDWGDDAEEPFRRSDDAEYLPDGRRDEQGDLLEGVNHHLVQYP